MLRADYKEDLDLFKKQESAINNLRCHIQEAVSRNYLIYTFRCDTPYDNRLSSGLPLLMTRRSFSSQRSTRS